MEQATTLTAGTHFLCSTSHLPCHPYFSFGNQQSTMTASFLSLPVEIQRQCIGFLDTAALKSMRLVASFIKDVTTEALFEVATLRFTEDSAEKFTTLIKNDEIRRYIRTVSIQVPEPPT
jgi:hypothetical protein